MSAYGKPPPQSHGFDTSRPFSESYGGAPAYVGLPPVSSGNPTDFHNVPLIAAMEFVGHSRMPYDDQAGPYLNVGSTPIPQVSSYRPSNGIKGVKMDVYISCLYEIATSNVPVFFLLFASRKCHASLLKMSQQGAVCQYMVSAEVPSFATTGWHSSQVPVYMLIESEDGELISKVDVGSFTYIDGTVQETGNAHEGSRKRKVSLESAELMKSPAKRVSSQQLRPKQELSTYGYNGSDGTAYSSFIQPGPLYGMQPYGRIPGQYHSQHQRSISQQYQYPSSATSSPPNLKTQSPQISTWSPFSAANSHVTQSPGLGGQQTTPRPSLAGLPSPLDANPPLIRTSTLQQTPSPATVPAGAQQSGQPYNPYPLYHNKAVLKLDGDLDSMAGDWTTDECSANRRIVMFKRTQSGCVITATFSPIPVDERPADSICISCIFWKDKRECYVTSVDTIYLLEKLVAARFTVEEKNRIRRNLEGFRPLTVSKAKQDSEDFFKLIMGFGSPKPRNIEKDVKVFPWKILVHALKKIIGKYSASPSSTLPPALLTPASSTGYVTEGSSILPHTNTDLNNNISPRTVSRTIPGVSSTNYAAGRTSRTFAPTGEQYLRVKNGGPPDLRYPTTTYSQGSEQHPQWQGSQQQHMQTSPYQQVGGEAASARSSWDFNGYLDTSPATVSASAIAGHGIRHTGNYSGRDMADGSRLSLSEGESKLRRAQEPSQQMPGS